MGGNITSTTPKHFAIVLTRIMPALRVVPAVWMFCGDPLLCGAQHKQCILKHLVRQQEARCMGESNRHLATDVLRFFMLRYLSLQPYGEPIHIFHGWERTPRGDARNVSVTEAAVVRHSPEDREVVDVVTPLCMPMGPYPRLKWWMRVPTHTVKRMVWRIHPQDHNSKPSYIPLPICLPSLSKHATPRPVGSV